MFILIFRIPNPPHNIKQVINDIFVLHLNLLGIKKPMTIANNRPKHDMMTPSKQEPKGSFCWG